MAVSLLGVMLSLQRTVGFMNRQTYINGAKYNSKPINKHEPNKGTSKFLAHETQYEKVEPKLTTTRSSYIYKSISKDTK